MAKLTKEQKIYLDAMQFALKIAKAQGIEELEREVTYRSSNPLPLNVSRIELTALARERARYELIFVATAMATTLIEHINMPPMIIKDYLMYFNKLVDVYRLDKDRFEADQRKLDENFVMNEMIKNYLKED